MEILKKYETDLITQVKLQLNKEDRSYFDSCISKFNDISVFDLGHDPISTNKISILSRAEVIFVLLKYNDPAKAGDIMDQIFGASNEMAVVIIQPQISADEDNNNQYITVSFNNSNC